MMNSTGIHKRSRKAVWFLALTAVLAASVFHYGNDGLEKDWGVKLELGFNKMPETGEIDAENQLWLGHRFARTTGGIATRWLSRNQADSIAYSSTLPTFEQLKALNPKERRAFVKRLSAAEKFDLFRGRLDFPLTLEERRRNLRDPQAELPLLQGWAIAASASHAGRLLRPFADFSFFRRSLAGVTMREPEEVVRQVRIHPGLDLEIPFAASDIKALISFYVGVRMKDRHPDLHQIGRESSPIEAGDYHTLLSNMVGIQGHPLNSLFVVGGEILPKPITRFESEIRIQEPNVYLVTSHLYTPVLRSPHFKAADPTEQTVEERMDVNYRLIVDKNQKIIQSEWLDGSRPIAALRAAPLELTPEFEKLGELYRPIPL